MGDKALVESRLRPHDHNGGSGGKKSRGGVRANVSRGENQCRAEGTELVNANRSCSPQKRRLSVLHCATRTHQRTGRTANRKKNKERIERKSHWWGSSGTWENMAKCLRDWGWREGALGSHTVDMWADLKGVPTNNGGRIRGEARSSQEKILEKDVGYRINQGFEQKVLPGEKIGERRTRSTATKERIEDYKRKRHHHKN